MSSSKGFRSPAKIARRLKLAPLAARHIQDWPRFMGCYSLGLVPRAPYRFRNGARLQIGRGVDHVPIIEIFMQDDYGTVSDGATIIDLGANIGAFSIYAATTARDVNVYAYEPMSEFFTLLQHNVRLNGVEETVRCFELAVAAEARPRDLFYQPAGRHFPALGNPGADYGPAVRARCTTLTQIISTNALDRVDLLKIDCEGAEYEILFNTPTDVFERILEIRMEYHDFGVEREDRQHLKNFLQSRNFVVTRDKPTSTTEGSLWARRHDAR